MQVHITAQRRLRFDDGLPVRAASAVVLHRGGHLVVQDDATHAALVRGASVERVRVFPPVEGHELFSSVDGTKHLKPDLEAAVALPGDRVLLLGSGSSPNRRRVALLDEREVVARDIGEVYDAVGAALDTPPGVLNLEGACLVGDRLRWFRRGAAQVPSASVDVELAALLAVVGGAPGEVPVERPLVYDLGAVDGVPLAVTDAVALPDGTVLVSTAAEDTQDPVEDGPVVAAGLALLAGERVVASAVLPPDEQGVHKVEGLAPLDTARRTLHLLAVVDDDDVEAASVELRLQVSLG